MEVARLCSRVAKALWASCGSKNLGCAPLVASPCRRKGLARRGRVDSQERPRPGLRQELLEDRVVAHVRKVELGIRNAVVGDLLLANLLDPVRETGLALIQLQEPGR